MSEYTEGPWQFNRGVSPHYQGQIYGDSGKTLAVTYDDESAANARLIASAPDLLDALENIAANLGNRRDHPGERWDDSLRRAREAIAKATSE